MFPPMRGYKPLAPGDADMLADAVARRNQARKEMTPFTSREEFQTYALWLPRTLKCKPVDLRNFKRDWVATPYNILNFNDMVHALYNMPKADAAYMAWDWITCSDLGQLTDQLRVTLSPFYSMEQRR